MTEKAFRWNIDQILVYIWQCCAGEQSEQEYPYSKFENSEAGKRLRLELESLVVDSVISAVDEIEPCGC